MRPPLGWPWPRSRLAVLALRISARRLLPANVDDPVLADHLQWRLTVGLLQKHLGHDGCCEPAAETI